MTTQEIHDICKKYEIKNYTINPDGSIDVEGSVYLFNMNLDKLPLKFNRVSGYFICSRNRLTSLEGCPKEVGETFYCSSNKLTSLQYSPEIVYGRFYCGDNPLESLDGYEGDYNNLICDHKDKLVRKHKLKKFLNDII